MYCSCHGINTTGIIFLSVEIKWLFTVPNIADIESIEFAESDFKTTAVVAFYRNLVVLNVDECIRLTTTSGLLLHPSRPATATDVQMLQVTILENS